MALKEKVNRQADFLTISDAILFRRTGGGGGGGGGGAITVNRLTSNYVLNWWTCNI